MVLSTKKPSGGVPDGVTDPRPHRSTKASSCQSRPAAAHRHDPESSTDLALVAVTLHDVDVLVGPMAAPDPPEADPPVVAALPECPAKVKTTPVS